MMIQQIDAQTGPAFEATTEYLAVAGGRLAYSDSHSDGRLVIMAPGLGDLRGAYRFLAPALVRAGYRVVTLDLRGHGESSTGWDDYSPEAVGHDMLALIAHLNAGPAVLVGASFAAAAAVWAAAEDPAAVAGLVFCGPSLRDVALSPLQRAMIKLLVGGPWRVRAWNWYYGTLYPTHRPADFAAYRAQLQANLAEAGRFAALTSMLWASKAGVEQRISEVQTPTLVVMGSRDPDFPDPQAEAAWIADHLPATVALIPAAGHYPHAEMPEIVLPELQQFLASLGH